MIDGVAHDCDCRGLLERGISALQWHDKVGEIEFVGHRYPNEITEEFGEFQQYIKAAKRPDPEQEATKVREADPLTRLGHNEPSPRFMGMAPPPANDQ
jgi:hypothetical protein